jgi:chromosome transmission fidelity protein 4
LKVSFYDIYLADFSFDRIERELLQIQMLMDCLDDELTTDDIFSREKAMDKEFILLIQVACKSDNIARAIELAKLLHHNVSFDAAMKIADFYHLVGLKEKIAIIKADREETEDRLILARNKRRRWLKAEPPLRQLVGSTIATSRFDPLGDSRPPPAIERPGMARVTVPVIEKTRYSSVAPLTQTPELPTWDQLTADSPPSTDSKRKRVDLESFPSSDMPMMPPPKISKIKLFMGWAVHLLTIILTHRKQSLCT